VTKVLYHILWGGGSAEWPDQIYAVTFNRLKPVCQHSWSQGTLVYAELAVSSPAETTAPTHEGMARLRGRKWPGKYLDGGPAKGGH